MKTTLKHFVIVATSIIINVSRLVGQCTVNGESIDSLGLTPSATPKWYQCSNLQISYNLNLTTIENWSGPVTVDWGDGTSNTTVPTFAPGSPISHSYAPLAPDLTDGDSLFITISNGTCTVTGILFRELPVIALIGIPSGDNTFCAPANLVFTNQSSNVSETTTFIWNFGDNTPPLNFDDQTQPPTVPHTFNSTLTCTPSITLTASNYCQRKIHGGASVSTTAAISIFNNDIPVISASVGLDSSAILFCYPDTAITFTNNSLQNCPSANIGIRSERWIFNRGSLGIDTVGPNIWPPAGDYLVTFPGIGSYQITLEVENLCGAVDTTITVEVVTPSTVGDASSTPTLCINTPLTDITHTTTGATGIGTPTGLPPGVVAAWANNIITISGTPTQSGTFNYSIPLTGGCETVSATGSIVVNPNVTPTISIAVTSGSNPSCASESITFSAIPANAGIPSYQWKVNGVNVGTDSANYSTSTLANGDIVTCEMIPSLACISLTPVTSNAIAVIIIPESTPTFTQVGPYCSGAVIPALPNVSSDGINGTWIPAINNQATTTYTFIPDFGSCAESVSFTITISSFGNCGCTEPQACNYNPVATLNNGLCLFYGCLDSAACNFDPNAGCYDGSCIYPDCNISGACNYNPSASCGDSSFCEFPGCIFMNACNYNPNAGCNNNSCLYPGCTDVTACNFISTAGCDNGSCTYAGCTNPLACNYNPDAGCDDGACSLPGCNEPSACNYNTDVLCGDTSLCEFPAFGYNCAGVCIADADSNGVCDLAGCTDSTACNFDPLAQLQLNCSYPFPYLDCNGQCLQDMDVDGICDPLEVVGCQDVSANNYDTLATDSGLCYYTPLIQVYIDENGNGIYDSADYGVPNYPLQVITLPYNDEYIVYTNAGGFMVYAFPSSVETIAVSASSLLGFSSSAITDAVIVPDTQFFLDLQDTLLIPLVLSNESISWGYELVSNNALTDTISCTENILSAIQIRNTGQSILSIDISLDLEPAFDAGFDLSEYTYPGALEAEFSDSSLNWQINNIPPLGNVLAGFSLLPFDVSDSIVIPCVYHLTFIDSLGNTLGHDTLQFNVATSCSVVDQINSLTAEPPGYYEPNFVSQGEWIDYYIGFSVGDEFSNSGIPGDDVSRDDCNSVYRVLVADTVDGLFFDLSSIELFSNSDVENCTPSITYISDSQVEVLFDFNGITLTGDTVDGILPYIGFAAFSVRLREDLPAGTVVPNQAWIRVLNAGDSSCTPPAITNEYLHTVYDCSFEVPSNISICSNDAVTIDANQEFVESYYWSFDDTLVSGSQFEFPPNSFGSYELALITSNALCADTNLVLVEIKEVPEILHITADTMICEGDGLQMIVETVNSEDIIVWDNGIMNGDIEFPPLTSNDYVVDITGPSGCEIQQTVSVGYAILPDSISHVDSNYLVLNSSDLQYQWYLNGDSLSGATSYIYSNGSLNADTLMVYVIHDTGCDTTLSFVTAEVDIMELIDAPFMVFPNPIEASSILQLPDGNYDVSIYESSGRQVFARKDARTQLELGALNLSAGCYQLKICGEGKTGIIKIIVN